MANTNEQISLKWINSNYLFYHLNDKEPLARHFSTVWIKAEKGKYRVDVIAKLEVLLKNVGGTTKININ